MDDHIGSRITVAYRSISTCAWRESFDRDRKGRGGNPGVDRENQEREGHRVTEVNEQKAAQVTAASLSRRKPQKQRVWGCPRVGGRHYSTARRQVPRVLGVHGDRSSPKDRSKRRDKVFSERARDANHYLGTCRDMLVQ